MLSKRVIVVLAAAAAVTMSNAYAHDPMTFSWTAQEVCLGGDRGSFTPDGDVTNGVNQIPAVGSGKIVFYPARSTAVDEGSWMYFLPVFLPGLPPGAPRIPQNLFPVRTSAGQCIWTYQTGEDGSWTLELPRAGCTSKDTSGPNAGVPVVFTNGPKINGQFAKDMESFVAHRTGLVLEDGVDGNGFMFERFCIRTIHGVRVPQGHK